MIRELLIEELRNAFDKSSWHGANLMSALRGVTPSQAIKRIHGRKCIWEQLLHAAYWKHRVLRKLGSTERFARKGSDWPALPAARNKQAWDEDLQMLIELQKTLIATVAKLPASKLADAKRRWLIHGAAAHDLYHAGQIKLLRRLIG